MASSSWSTPAAILVGFSLVAVAIYFGLRDRGAGVAAFPAAPGASISATASAAPLVQPPSGSLSPAVALAAPGIAVAGVPGIQNENAEAIAAFETQRPALVAACGAQQGKEGASPPASYEFNLSFDPAGHEVGRGLSELHGARPEITKCIIAHRVPIEVPARGVRSQARVPFTIP